MEELTDEALLQQIGSGNEAALAALYDRYGKMAYSLACRIVGDVHSAEDVVQEAFINVWRMAGSFATGRGSARTWLLAVVRHKGIDVCRQRRGVAPNETSLEPQYLLAGDTDIWAEVSNTLDRETLENCLSHLPVEQREPIEMAYFQGYTQREISEIKEIPLGTVKGRIRLGMEKLRNLLIERQLGGSPHEP